MDTVRYIFESGGDFELKLGDDLVQLSVLKPRKKNNRARVVVLWDCSRAAFVRTILECCNDVADADHWEPFYLNPNAQTIAYRALINNINNNNNIQDNNDNHNDSNQLKNYIDSMLDENQGYILVDEIPANNLVNYPASQFVVLRVFAKSFIKNTVTFDIPHSLVGDEIFWKKIMGKNPKINTVELKLHFAKDCHSKEKLRDYIKCTFG